MKFAKRACILSLAATMLFTSGVFAGTNITKITAYLNKGLTLKLNGEVLKPTEDDGTRLYPIVYNGRTYLPAKVVAEGLGASVDYDNSGNGTVIITSGTSDDAAGRPTKDASSGNTSSNNNNNNNSSSNSNNNEDESSTSKYTGTATLESPVPMGQTYGWDVKDILYTYPRTSHVNVTVNSCRTITLDDVEDLGFKRPDADSDIEYAIVNVTYDVSDAKISSCEYEDVQTAFLPDLSGVTTIENHTIVGGSWSGFDNSLGNKLTDMFNWEDAVPDKKYSFKVTGDILMPLNKGENNLLRFYKRADYWNLSYDEQDSITVYFKLYK